jgi:hypothetical protein
VIVSRFLHTAADRTAAPPSHRKHERRPVSRPAILDTAEREYDRPEKHSGTRPESPLC